MQTTPSCKQIHPEATVSANRVAQTKTGCSSARLEYTSGGRGVAGSNPVIPTRRKRFDNLSNLFYFFYIPQQLFWNAGTSAKITNYCHVLVDIVARNLYIKNTALPFRCAVFDYAVKRYYHLRLSTELP